jgi:hypothetical protein
MRLDAAFTSGTGACNRDHQGLDRERERAVQQELALKSRKSVYPSD